MIVLVDKESLRANYKRQVEKLSSNEKQEQSAVIVSALQKFLSDKSGVWTLFSPLNDEPKLTELAKLCPHLEWVFPRVESATTMNFFKVQCLNEMVSSSWGITEPEDNPDCLVSADRIDGCIMPGMAFDRFGNRLGRGGGFYDRFLTNFKGLKLGVTFQQALTEERLPSESHDQKMNIVVSPSEWIEVR